MISNILSLNEVIDNQENFQLEPLIGPTPKTSCVIDTAHVLHQINKNDDALNLYQRDDTEIDWGSKFVYIKK